MLNDLQQTRDKVSLLHSINTGLAVWPFYKHGILELLAEISKEDFRLYVIKKFLSLNKLKIIFLKFWYEFRISEQ